MTGCDDEKARYFSIEAANLCQVELCLRMGARSACEHRGYGCRDAELDGKSSAWHQQLESALVLFSAA